VARRAEGSLAFPADPAWLLPVRRVSARLRARMRLRLRRTAPELYAQVPAAAWRQAWVVHSQPAGRGAEALSYLARYIYKTALSSARLLGQDERTVTFSYRESGTGTERTCTLAGEEFLRRYLQHVLPKGFRRVRAYGWLSPAAGASFARVAALLQAPPPATPPTPPPVTLLCPHCGRPMRRAAPHPPAPHHEPAAQAQLLSRPGRWRTARRPRRSCARTAPRPPFSPGARPIYRPPNEDRFPAARVWRGLANTLREHPRARLTISPQKLFP